MLHKLWIEKGESCKLVLIQIHHKDFVGGRQIRLFRGELPIKIAHVFAVSLEWASKKETSNKVAKKEKGFKPAEKWVWHTVRNLYFLSKNSTLISREKLAKKLNEKLVKMMGFVNFLGKNLTFRIVCVEKKPRFSIEKWSKTLVNLGFERKPFEKVKKIYCFVRE